MLKRGRSPAGACDGSSGRVGDPARPRGGPGAPDPIDARRELPAGLVGGWSRVAAGGLAGAHAECGHPSERTAGSTEHRTGPHVISVRARPRPGQRISVRRRSRPARERPRRRRRGAACRQPRYHWSALATAFVCRRPGCSIRRASRRVVAVCAQPDAHRNAESWLRPRSRARCHFLPGAQSGHR